MLPAKTDHKKRQCHTTIVLPKLIWVYISLCDASRSLCTAFEYESLQFCQHCECRGGLPGAIERRVKHQRAIASLAHKGNVHCPICFQSELGRILRIVSLRRGLSGCEITTSVNFWWAYINLSKYCGTNSADSILRIISYEKPLRLMILRLHIFFYIFEKLFV